MNRATRDWTGCYDDGWRDLIVPEAFSHPAKMARGLVARTGDDAGLGRRESAAGASAFQGGGQAR